MIKPIETTVGATRYSLKPCGGVGKFLKFESTNVDGVKTTFIPVELFKLFSLSEMVEGSYNALELGTRLHQALEGKT